MQKKDTCLSKRFSTYKVEPIKNMEDIFKIKKLLYGSPRDMLLFIMGINSWLCVSDLLHIKTSDIQDAVPGDKIIVRPEKPGDQGILIINCAIYDVLQIYFHELGSREKPIDQEYLFQSRKGDGPLTVSTVNNMVKAWTKAVGLEGNYGGHSLRKTWGYHHWTDAAIENYTCISRKFNHATESITQRYLGISRDTINPIKYREIGLEPVKTERLFIAHQETINVPFRS